VSPIYSLGQTFSVATTIIFWGIAWIVLVRFFLGSLGFTRVLPSFIPIPISKIREYVASIFSEKDAPLINGRIIAYKKGLHINIKIIIFGIGVRLAFLVLGFFFMHPEGWQGSLIGIFHNFNRWDAHHYLRIATYGYSWTENGRNLMVVFFPLYPYIIRVVSIFVRDVLVAAYIVSFASFIAGLCYIYHLVKLDFCKRTAWWAVALISIFPTAFFYGAPHTESLFILTTAATLYYIRSHKWLLAGIAGALASATRMVGIILLVAAAVEFIMHYKLFTLMKIGTWKRFFELIFTKGALILIMLTGTAIYLLLNWHYTGDPFQFMYYQSTHWHNNFQSFGQTMRTQFGLLPLDKFADWRYSSMLYTHLPNILGFGFSIWMLLYACLRRHRVGYIVYSLGYIFVSFSPSWLLSGGRYAAALVPSFIFLADYVNRKPLKRGAVIIVIFVALLLLMLRMYVQGGHIM